MSSRRRTDHGGSGALLHLVRFSSCFFVDGGWFCLSRWIHLRGLRVVHQWLYRCAQGTTQIREVAIYIHLCHLWNNTQLSRMYWTPLTAFIFTGGNPRASVWPTEIFWPMFDGMSNIISWATRTEETRSLCKICGEIEVKHQVFGVTVRTVCHIWRVSPLMLPWRTAGCEILGGLIWRKY